MTARTLLQKNCLKPSTLIQAVPRKKLLRNKNVNVPGCQTSRQATTTSMADNLSNTKPSTPSPSVSSSFINNGTKSVSPIDFTSTEGKKLFRGALVQGHAESFFKLMGNFSNQSSPFYGGVSSLAMVLNALEIDPKKIWKGNWRWFSSDQMKTCSPVELIQERGIPFDEFTCLAQTHCRVEAHRGASYEQFLKDLEFVTSDTVSQMVVNYSRAILGQKDTVAHFSPIGGFNRKENQVLIMDVARGNYPSIWVDAKILHKAMMTPSSDENGRSRGYFVLSNDDPYRTLSNKAVMASSIRLTCKDCSRSCHSQS